METENRWMNANSAVGMKNTFPAATMNTTVKTPISMKVSPLPEWVREAINILRGNLQLSAYNLKVICVTSALKHEGKSSIAFHLARSFASLSKKTLYIDCDIRNSVTVSRYHVGGRIMGLTEYLCGGVSLASVICNSGNPYMDMIFTGAIAPNPSELLSGPVFEQMMKELREQYDYIIVDCPPINPVIDGMIIAKQCEGTVFVVESEVTDRKQSMKAKKSLEYAGVKILGVVLNKVQVKNNRYGYGYGYGYGYSDNNKRKKDLDTAKKKKAEKRARR